jgi:hypothetical protein
LAGDDGGLPSAAAVISFAAVSFGRSSALALTQRFFDNLFQKIKI